MRVRILASARQDLVEGFRFYDSQASGVGDYFLASVSADIERLRFTAGIHPIIHRDYHRSLCRTFPFAIYYTKSGEEVTVYAIVDCGRDPAWIHYHLEKSGDQAE